MRLLNRSSWCAAGLAAGWLAVHAAAADETAEVAEAILENPDCVGATLANEAINEGLRRGGRRLLSRLGVNAPQRAAAVPCGDAQAAAEPADAPAAVQTPAPAQPAAAQAASAASRTAAASTASTAAAEPEQRSGPFARLRQAATNPNPSTNQRGRNCGVLGTTCANGLDALVACVNEVSFWGEMAVAVERKRDSTPNLTAQQRKEIEEDLAAMRKAHQTQASRVEPVDPARPNRHLDWLTPEEYSAAATAAAQKLNAHKQECDRKHVRF